jgi:hypothetical protein
VKEATGDHPENPTLELPCRVVFAAGQRGVEIIGPLLEDEAAALQAGFWNRGSNVREIAPVNVRAYLVGPEVFLREAEALALAKREFCKRYGLTGISPMTMSSISLIYPKDKPPCGSP